MSGRYASLALLLVTLVVGCSQAATASAQLARDQTFRFAIPSAPSDGGTSLDPGQVNDEALMTDISSNLFDGLYRLDDELQNQPDIAMGPPQVSGDGLTYTFHLRHDVRFWNGDPVTAADFIYSWNRELEVQGGWVSIFQPVAGFSDNHLDVTAPDAYTLVVRLSAPTGYWLAEMAVAPAAWVVDRRAVTQGGDRWWTSPDALVGTGPFRLTNWTRDELDFAPVPNWWGGSTGTLTRVELHVATKDNAWTGYSDGRFDLVGYGNPGFASANAKQIAAIRSDPATRSQVHTWPFGATDSVAFNLVSGVFSGFGQGLELREAFSEAIDRTKLAQAVCAAGTICVPATGGMISRGLTGYLGDGTDPGARFDPAAARAIVKRLDPTGTLLGSLTYYYPVPAHEPSELTAENLAGQWSANLGVKVELRALDRQAYFNNVFRGNFAFWREGWQADYDSPQDWFDNLFIEEPGCAPCNPGSAYGRPGFSSLLAAADQKAAAIAASDYRRASQLLAGDYVYLALYYLVRTVVIKPYVQGFSANEFGEDRWTTLQILQH